ERGNWNDGSKEVFERVQSGRDSAATKRADGGGSGAGAGSTPVGTAPLAARAGPTRRAGVSRSGQEARRTEPGGRPGAQDRATGLGDRFFKKGLAACRRTAPAAGPEYRRNFYQHIEKEEQ